MYLSQVSHDSGSVTIDPRKAERAMLIKNCAGDWGIIRAPWYDPEKGENSEGDWGISSGLCGMILRKVRIVRETGAFIRANCGMILRKVTTNSEGDWGIIRA